MRVTKTKIETTLYDTNGKQVSVVRKEITEVDTQTHLLNREEGKQVKEKVTVYQTNLNNAKSIKDNLQKTRGHKHGQRIFSSMVDLIMVVDNPLVGTTVEGSYKHTLTIKGENISVASAIWASANKEDSFFKPGPTKKNKREKH